MSNRSIAQASQDQQEQPSATALIKRYYGDFKMVLPSHVDPDVFTRWAQSAVMRNEDVARIAQTNPASFLFALLDCARLGLQPGETYHLLPFGNEITGDPDYTGLMELMYRARAVRPGGVKVEIVHERDLDIDRKDTTAEYPGGRPRFVWKPGAMARPHHNPDWWADRGPMIGAYCYAEMADGGVSQVVLFRKDEIEKVRAVSKTAHRSDSPWNKWEDRMWKKTVIRQLAKYVPTSAEFRQDDRRDAVQVEAERLNTPTPAEVDAGRRVPPMRGLLDGADSSMVYDGEPVEDEPAPPPQQQKPSARPQQQGPKASSAEQHKAIASMLGKLGVSKDDERRTVVAKLSERPDLTSMKDLTSAQASTVIDYLNRLLEKSDSPADDLRVALAQLDEQDAATTGQQSLDGAK